MFDVCTTGDTAHIDTILKFLPHTLQHGCLDILHCCNDPCLYVNEVMWQWYFAFAYFARNAHCAATTDLLVWYSNTQNDFSSGAAIFSLHKLASPGSRNVNYDEKQLTGKKILSFSFYLYRFRKYMSYGFPIINFCNPGVHYETPVEFAGRKFYVLVDNNGKTVLDPHGDRKQIIYWQLRQPSLSGLLKVVFIPSTLFWSGYELWDLGFFVRADRFFFSPERPYPVWSNPGICWQGFGLLSLGLSCHIVKVITLFNLVPRLRISIPPFTTTCLHVSDRDIQG